MKPVFKKLIAIGALSALVLSGFVFDLIWSHSFEIKFDTPVRIEEKPYIDAEGHVVPSDVGISDGATTMAMRATLTHFGKGKANHTLYIKTNRDVVGRFISDENGVVEFTYNCYYASKDPEDVVFTARDESNSIFVAVYATGTCSMEMRLPSRLPEGSMTTNDIFFD